MSEPYPTEGDLARWECDLPYNLYSPVTLPFVPTVACPICGTDLVLDRLDAANSLARCPNCAHRLRELSECPAGARAQAYGGEPTLDVWRQRLSFRRLKRLVPDRGRVFEIGFGAGAMLATFAAHGYAVGGVDSDQLGRSAAAANQPGALRHGDAAAVRLEVGESPYDLVIGVHVIEHVPDPLAVARAAFALLTPGGRIALITPSADSLGLRWFGPAWWMLEDPTHLAFFSPSSITLALTQAGFEDVQISRPLLESVTCEAASWRRRGRTEATGGPGVLAERSTLVLAAVTLPLNVIVRLFRRRLVPAMLITARRADGVV